MGKKLASKRKTSVRKCMLIKMVAL